MFSKFIFLLLPVCVYALTACGPRASQSGESEQSSTSSSPLMRSVLKAAASSPVCVSAIEHTNATLSCPKGSKITAIQFANYGVSSGACGSYAVSSCAASNSLSVAQAACVGKASCTIAADNTAFGDPCEGTQKSLTIQAVCSGTSATPTPTPKPTPTATPTPVPTATPAGDSVCASAVEHTNLQVSCANGKAITAVTYANYGTSSGSCGSYVKGSCAASNSLSVVQAACLGKSSCVVESSNGPFGDPCEGTQKSLVVQVSCGGTASTPTPTPTVTPTATPSPTATPKPTPTPTPTPVVGQPGSGSWSYDLDTNHAALALYAINDSGALVATPMSSGAKPYAFAVNNEFGRIVAYLTPVAQGNGSYAYALPTNRYGYFEIKPTEGNASQLIPAVGSRPAGMLTYAVLKAPDANPSADFQDEYTNIQGTTIEPGADYLGDGTFSWLGYSSYGTSYYSWYECQPNQATAQADCQSHMANDPVVGLYKSKKMIPLFYMNNYPAWAVGSTDGNVFGKAPLNMSQWQAYLEYAVPLITQRYDFLPYRRYQITWEPNDGWGWSGTDEQFLSIYQIAYNTIKKYDPTAVVMGPTLANLGPEMKSQFQRLLGKGLGNYMNAISMHPYPALSQIHDLDDQWIADFRAIATQATGKVMPMYMTESGLSDYEMSFTGSFPVNSNNFAIYHAVGNIAMALLEKNDGSSMHTYFYTADYASQPHYGLFYNATAAYSFGPSKVAPKPDVPMIRQVNDLLNHTNAVGRLVNPAGNTNQYVLYFQNKHTGVYMAALWDPSGGNSSIALPVGAAQVKVMDAHGNATTVNSVNGVLNLTLGITPTYVEGISASALIGLTPAASMGTR